MKLSKGQYLRIKKYTLPEMENFINITYETGVNDALEGLADEKIKLKTITVEELMQIKGIGPILSERIFNACNALAK